MTWVDAILVVGALLVALAGWRSGVIATVASFAGFVGGVVAGAWLVPRVLEGRDWSPAASAFALVAAMLLLGLVGQSVMGLLGRSIRDLVDVAPLRTLDQLSGLLVSVGAFLFSAWMLLSVAAAVPVTEHAVRSSRSFPVLDQYLSGPGNALIDEARTLLSTFDLPSLPFNAATLPPVDEPTDVALGGAIAESSRRSVLQVVATSTRCGISQVGSGVVLADKRVVTNAHVVAGSGRITVRVSGQRRTKPATLVAVDRSNDVAVLRVPGLEAPALDWAQETGRGTDGAVAGYPGGGGLTVGAARVRGKASVAQAGQAGTRRVIVFRGLVRPGNSGGALLDTSGDLMGVVFANSSTDETTGFALTRAEVAPVLAEGVDSTAEVSSGSCPAR